MQITDVRVRKVTSQNKMKAIASITIDDVFVVHDIKVIGEFKDIAHPINTETREMLQNLIIEKYNEAE